MPGFTCFDINVVNQVFQLDPENFFLAFGANNNMKITFDSNSFGFVANNVKSTVIDNLGHLMSGTTVDPVFQGFPSQAVFASNPSLYNGVWYLAYGSQSANYVILSGTNGATPTNNTIVANNQSIGGHLYAGNDGNGYQTCAIVECQIEGTPSAGNVPARLMFTVFGSERLRIDSKGNIIVNHGSIATNATDGFLYIPTCAGAPTGVPTSYSGRVPMVYDTTNHKFWLYDSGWKGVVVA